MTKEDCAYIAGFIDTDGWIIIKLANRNTTHNYQVAVVNRHKETLEWIQSLFGGNLTARKISRKSPHAKNWTQTYDLIFRKDEISDLLRLVFPYLKIKKEQATLVLRLIESKENKKQFRLTDDVRRYRDYLYRKCRELNWAGVDRSGIENIVTTAHGE